MPNQPLKPEYCRLSVWNFPLELRWALKEQATKLHITLAELVEKVLSNYVKSITE